MGKRFAAILVAALTSLASGAVLAQMDGANPPDGPMRGLVHDQDRFADRFFVDFDLNHDGRVTRDEMNKALAARFASVARGGAMTADQFATLRKDQVRQHLAQVFHRLDWNGDGKLTLDEFAGPQRVRFEMLDRDGHGNESCSTDMVQRAAYRPGRDFRRSSGRARFCAENDLNHDGTVTHSELDSVIAKRFAEDTGGAKAMSEEQFEAATLKIYRQSSANYFARIDADRDGKLSLAEFAAPEQSLFSRLDKNHDGSVTHDEISGGQYRSKTHRGG